MRVQVAVVSCLVASGCAGMFGSSGMAPGNAAMRAGWQDLLVGHHVDASHAFHVALAEDPGSILAVWGQAVLAYERGDDVAALDLMMGLLGAAAQDPGAVDPWAPLIGTAAATRLATLIESVPVRRPMEDRILALSRQGLPWQAQVILADLSDGILRRRADVAGLGSMGQTARCLTRGRLLGIGGLLPHLDLDGRESRYPKPFDLDSSGCRLTIPAVQTRPGVRQIELDLPADREPRILVMDFEGPARFGPAATVHGTPWAYGPHWSVSAPFVSSGTIVHARLGTYGGLTALRVFALHPSAQANAPPGIDADKTDSAIAALADVLVADAQGDVDRTLRAVETVRRHRQFAVGLATIAGVVARDVTRPVDLIGDEARRLRKRAVQIDPAFARVFRDLAQADLALDRASDAAAHAEQARAARPGWWPADLVLAEALRSRGLERDADRALQRALSSSAGGVCVVLREGARRAQERHRQDDERRFIAALVSCDAQSDAAYDRARSRGETKIAKDLFEKAAPVATDHLWTHQERARFLLALDDHRGAEAEIREALKLSPQDPGARLRLADLMLAKGDGLSGKNLVADTLALHPTRSEVRQAARVLGVPMPVDADRVDGRAVIRSFVSSGRGYDAPAVLVLDRLVHRIATDGTQWLLTHSIVRVQSKDALQRWGEVQIPEGAEVLTLRTHKPDGSLREPEEIVGKPTVSAPELAPGDFVEWETLETRSPSPGFAPGFLGERFYFQSLEAPLDLSQYVVIAPARLKIDSDPRAGAPAVTVENGANGTRVFRFEARAAKQKFAERSPTPGIDWMPSVRVSALVTVDAWRRFLSEQLFGSARSSPALKQAAAQIRSDAGNQDLPAAVVRFLTDHIEPESAGLQEAATATLARGRGSRPTLALALARELGIPATLVFARATSTAPADAPVVAQELDDFADALIRFGTPTDVGRFVDLRLRRAPMGYVPPALDGARYLSLDASVNRLQRVQRTIEDGRRVKVQLHLAPDGTGRGDVTETLTGWPALEWFELVEQNVRDERNLRKGFEQRLLNQHFPGTQLGRLEASLVDRAKATATVRYTFTGAQMATRRGNELVFQPGFFKSAPGRRYATEEIRRTALQLGPEVPINLEALIFGPKGARVTQAGPSLAVKTGTLRFRESRTPLRTGPDGQPLVQILRESVVPLVRVAPNDYPIVAGELRRVDPAEEAEIRFFLSVP